ncbi:MAG: hypothetical protein HYS38_03855 [Acidobacteria bacterium]|nr:hypothetical protein [Acidobacteriota bacterium]
MAKLASTETLRALDPDLPLLASKAAIELDVFIRGNAGELKATKLLASMISRSFPGGEEGKEPKFFIDPAAATLITSAFHQSGWAGSVKTVADLVREAAKVAVNLENPSLDVNRETLGQARAFCAALAESAASYLHSRYSQHPAHPYRR